MFISDLESIAGKPVFKTNRSYVVIVSAQDTSIVLIKSGNPDPRCKSVLDT